MKMTNEDFNHLQNKLLEKHFSLSQDSNYLTYLNKHSNTRIGWDLIKSSNQLSWVCDHLYKYLDDSHIDTALNKIISYLKNVK